MVIQNNTIIQPIPNAELLEKKEREWEIILPEKYKKFIMNYNGGIPNESSFECNEHSYAITRFLCILENIKETEDAWYDISVVESQIGERLTDNEDLTGVEILPIAELFAGDYLCLDYREHKEEPCVCVWSHEESGEFNPVTYKVTNTFSDFIAILV